jgi:ATP-dependent DNA helicase Rep
LTLSYCLARKKYGQDFACHPSPFLKELPEELLEKISASTQKPVTQETGQNFFANLKQALG